ncbi:methyltransferase [Aliivibrio fischeri]|uniref:methyltransferase n=1 Tax=Aliivibrio fischeri TaxID=668 RepID=UPI0007C54CA4|nr:methyltransferase [Aliivibrio fischeri]MCE7536458.1 SAM-dependent methyltransferase [Aliivibrio fischeri]MCE7559491.1 SAM-dependent methyltransferase [Aliivibrio fischeri]
MHSQQFLNMDRLLSQTVFFWQFSAFHSSDYPWRTTHENLSHWLDGLTLAEVQELKRVPEKLTQALSAFIPEVNDLYALSQLEQLQAAPLVMPKGLDSGINGRKWQQITSLSALGIQYSQPKGQWLEWCGGKGYLGRVLNVASGKPVTTLEWQDTLCHSGQEYADKHQLNMTFIQGDALATSASELIKANQHAIALHACGDLHVSLIQKGIDKSIDAVTLSPCCFHLTQSSVYEGLSVLSKQAQIRLSKEDLRLPLQETVTAGKRTQHHREQEMQYRLGFNTLQQFVTGNDNYVSVPSIKKSLLSDGFDAFCRWASEHKKLQLPDDVDFSHWLNKGKEAFVVMEKCDLVQQVFKRPLEVWLCLDRVLLLEEAGYNVRIGEFCLKEDTPRNIVIQAKKV